MYRRLFHEMLEGFALHEIVPDQVGGGPRDYRFLEVNAEFERLTGMDRDRLVGQTLLETFPDINPDWLRRYGDVFSTGVPARFEGYSALLDKHLALSAFKLDGKKLACLVMDISDRKRSESALRQTEQRLKRLVETLERSEAALASLVDEKDALLREVHHRVKNNLQIIVSLMNIERGRLGDADPAGESLMRMQDRILSMADVHDALYRSASHSAADLGVAMQSIAERLSDTYDAASRGITMAIRPGELLLPLDFAVPCCLALNELVTNALEHAFPDGWTGPRTVEVAVDVTDAGRVAIKVADSGIGIAREAAAAAADDVGGLRLVHLLTEQLDGAFDISSENGSSFELSFAVP